LTTTPRQRIAVRREMARQPPASPVQRALLDQYAYDGIETCAADGSCMLACPLGIDTGKLIKGFRESQHTERAERAALGAARRWAAIERTSRGTLRAGNAASRIGSDAVLRQLSTLPRRLVTPELIPEWGEAMPRAAPPRPPRTAREGAQAVYLPACINRIFGPPRSGGPARPLPEALVAVSERARSPVWIPPDAPGHCCGTPWSSKGYRRGHEWMANHLVDALWRWSDRASLPVVVDASSCTNGIVNDAPQVLSEENRARHAELEVIDSVAWALDRLLPRLDVAAKLRSVALHPTCSGRHLGLDRALLALAGELADDVRVPPSAACCGFAGDRGFLHPELTEAATRHEAAEVNAEAFEAHLSSNRTCEIGMERATGKPYLHAVQALEELTRASDRAVGQERSASVEITAS
jgi:D-lactate dehydrogenase